MLIALLDVKRILEIYSRFLTTSGLTWLSDKATIPPIYVYCHIVFGKETRQEEASAPGMKEMELPDRFAVGSLLSF